MRTELLDALAGATEVDLVVTNGRIVDVHRREIVEGGVAVKAGHIIRSGDVSALSGSARRAIDAEGRYLTPGLIESHAHSYHTNLNMTEYARLCLGRGTTAVAESFYGQGQIGGIDAVRFSYDELRRTPLAVLFVVPVLAYLQNIELGLPPTPGTVTGEDLLAMLDWPGCVGLEEPPYIPVAERDPAVVRLIERALELGKVVMGHAAGLTDEELDAYASFGVTGDHECVTAEEAVARLRHGMMVSLRETPIARNQREVQRAITELGSDPRLFMFCSDVPDAVSFTRSGHIDEFIRIAVRAGVEPIDAVCMGSVNAARYYRVDHLLGSLAPGRRADILLVGDLERFDVHSVVAGGIPVVTSGERSHGFDRPVYPAFLRSTLRLAGRVTPAQLELPAPEGSTTVTVRAIGAESLLSDERRYELSVVDGLVPADVECDVLKVAMFDRYARRSVPAVAFMQGFRLRRGAIGTTYNPYFNNVMVLGTNDEDMAVAANAVAEGGGGFAVVDGGKVRAHLALPLFGILSDGPLDDFVAAMERLHEEARDLGCAIEWPFHTLAFTAVGGELPRLKLSGLGLFDVTERRLLDTIVA